MLRPLLKVQMWFCVAGAQGILHPDKSEQNVRVLNKFQKRLQVWGIWRKSRKMHFCVAGAIQETCSSEMLGGQGADFLRRGCILEHQIFRFAKMILRDRWSALYDLASLFPGKRSTLDRWSGKSQNALVWGHQLCTQLSIFEGSLAELLRFWHSQLRKLRKSSRIASFLMLSTSKIEEC